MQESYYFPLLSGVFFSFSVPNIGFSISQSSIPFSLMASWNSKFQNITRAHKGVIPTPNIANFFHPTPDIEGKKCPTPDIQNLPPQAAVTP